MHHFRKHGWADLAPPRYQSLFAFISLLFILGHLANLTLASTALFLCKLRHPLQLLRGQFVNKRFAFALVRSRVHETILPEVLQNLFHVRLALETLAFCFRPAFV